MTDLPLPSSEALEHSEKLKNLLLERMQAGSLSFADFMKACLYEPGLGYYVAGSRKFGDAGDFVTAPMISYLFGMTLVQATFSMVQECRGAYLELGAGTGAMAASMIEWLVGQGDFTTPYYILEVSPDCRAQQAYTLQAYGDRVQWLDTLPTKFHGVILANEVLDALPIHLFHYQNQNLFERRVAAQAGNFIWQDEPLTDPLLLTAVEQLHLPQPSRQEYLSEINPTLPSFIDSLLDSLTLGQIILIDYGFLRETYYHPDRTMGTLMCHYRHHAHPDPFLYPGLQDITAHVDFTTVGLTAQAAGAEVALYSQAEYLLENGILRNFESVCVEMDELQRIRLSKGLQTLIQPHEMGELFKVMVISK